MVRVTVNIYKGGEGKTTIAVSLAVSAALSGFRTLLVDLDQNRSALLWFDVKPRLDLASYLVKGEGGEGLLEEVSCVSGLYMAEGGAALEEVLSGDPYLLLDRMMPVFKDFDFVFFDTPPWFGSVLKAALIASTHFLVPMSPSYLGAAGFAALARFVVEVLQYQPALKFLGVVLNMVSARERVSREMTVWVRENLGREGVPVFDTVVRRSVRFREAVFKHIPVQLLGKAGGCAYEDVESLWSEFVRRLQEV